MNRVIESGRFTKDPECAVSAGGKKSIRFNLAVQRDFKNSDGNYESDFPSFVAFGKTAEFIEKYFKKGSWAEIEGALRTGSYTNKDGVKVYTTDVWVDKAGFGGASKASNAAANTQAQSPSTVEEGFMQIPDNIEDSPFG